VLIHPLFRHALHAFRFSRPRRHVQLDQNIWFNDVFVLQREGREKEVLPEWIAG
jgi:hypothetical protein